MDDSILEIKRFGPINEAKIHIGKINIIAGKNASGKTTSSKILYSFIAASSNEGERIYINKMNKTFESLINELLRNFDVDLIDQELRNLKECYNNLEFSKKSQIYKVKKTIETLKKITKHERINSKNLNTLFKNVLESFTKWDNPELRKLESFQMLLYDEFGEDDEFFDEDVDKASLKFYKKDSTIFIGADAPFKKIKHFYSDWLPVNDIFYMETPYIFDFSIFSDLSQNSYNLSQNSYKLLLNSKKERFSHHQKSLIEKLYSEKPNEWKFYDEKKNDKDPLEMIEKIIRGHFYYNNQIREIRFKQCEKEFHVKNTASGIKTIALLQILLEKGLDTNSFLIIDEPEVHLHPEWQIIFAEVVTVLAKMWDMRFYINTHSPYFIEAIEVYSEKYDLIEDTNFYLTEILQNEALGCLKNFDINKIPRNELVDIYDHLGNPYDILDKTIVNNLL